MEVKHKIYLSFVDKLSTIKIRVFSILEHIFKNKYPKKKSLSLIIAKVLNLNMKYKNHMISVITVPLSKDIRDKIHNGTAFI